jgi:hypothetical protein
MIQGTSGCDQADHPEFAGQRTTGFLPTRQDGLLTTFRSSWKPQAFDRLSRAAVSDARSARNGCSQNVGNAVSGDSCRRTELERMNTRDLSKEGHLFGI